jgi:MoaA/NifB/PqqE/SkfB family radical SAM enzyme
MSVDTFARLRRTFQRTGLVYLQGWGEPFLHPQIFEFVELAKAAGCRVGTSTNGTLLDEEKLQRLIDLDLDVIAFSIAGTTEENDRRRKGTSLQAVLTAIEMLKRLKQDGGKDKPAVHIAYLLLRSGMDEVAKLPDLLKGTGVSQVVISTLDFVPHKSLDEEAVRPQQLDEYRAIKKQLDEVIDTGTSYGIDIHYSLYHPHLRRDFCSENIMHALFISANGIVSPCVFMNLPIDDRTCSDDANIRLPLEAKFGDVFLHSLEEIWYSKSYRRFRNAQYTTELPVQCSTCPKMKVM